MTKGAFGLPSDIFIKVTFS